MMKSLLILVALCLVPSIASADNFYVIGPKGQYTYGSIGPRGGYYVQNGTRYNQVWTTPRYDNTFDRVYFAGQRYGGYGSGQYQYNNYNYGVQYSNNYGYGW